MYNKHTSHRENVSFDCWDQADKPTMARLEKTVWPRMAPQVGAVTFLKEFWYGMVNVDLYSTIITKVSNALKFPSSPGH